MNFIQFIKTKVFWLQILIAIVVIVLLIVVVMMSLSSYTHHGEKIEVPNIEGYKFDQIKAIIGKADIEFVVSDSMFKDGVAPGAVIDQHPKAGSYVKSGRKVYLTINAYSKEMVTIPSDLINNANSLRNAKYVLDMIGMKVGRIEYKPSEHDDLVLALLVNGSQLREGDRLPKGTVIDIVVSKSGGNACIVPDVLNYNFADAKSAVKAAGLSIGAVIYDKTVTCKEDSDVAVIYRQSPEAINAASLPAGSSVNIWLTLDVQKAVKSNFDDIDEDYTDLEIDSQTDEE